jgi:hypothetical protein
MISRERAGTVNGWGGGFRPWVAEIPSLGALFALRYSKICDNSHIISIFYRRNREITDEIGHGD